MRARQIDLTAVNPSIFIARQQSSVDARTSGVPFPVRRRARLAAEEVAVEAMARRPWFYLLAAWTFGRTIDILVERQARRERRVRELRSF